MAVLGNPKNTIEVLQKYQFNFQKKYGQNFLIDTRILEQIIAAAGVSRDDFVLEIGPGIGTMTQYLCEAAREVVAVEIDNNLIPILQDTLGAYDNVEVINEDILKVDLPTLLEEEFSGMEVFVCANLPYYITSPILMYIMEQRLPIEAITVMVQKEAALRLCAPMGSRDCSAITFAVRYYAEPKLLFHVSRGSFMPAPNVDSAVIRLDLKKERPAGVDSVEEENYLFEVVRAAFSQRRKTLPNPLSSGLHLPKAAVIEAMEGCGIAPTARAESLSMEQYIALAKALKGIR